MYIFNKNIKIREKKSMFTLSLQPLNISHLLLHSKRSRGVTEGILQPSYIFPLPSYLLPLTYNYAVKIGRVTDVKSILIYL